MCVYMHVFVLTCVCVVCQIDAFVFDKTGTLTEGKPSVESMYDPQFHKMFHEVFFYFRGFFEVS